MAKMVLEPPAGEIQQLWRRLKVDLCTEHVLMTEIGGQPWQLRVYIRSGKCPCSETMHCEGMAHLIRSRADPAGGWFDRQLTKQPPNCLRCRLHCKRGSVQANEQCLRILDATIPKNLPTRFEILMQLTGQIRAECDDAGSSLAVRYKEGVSAQINFLHTQAYRLSKTQASAVKHQHQCTKHGCPDPAAVMFARRMQKPKHFLLREDVRKKQRFLDWRERMLGNISGWIVAAPVKAQLTDYSEFQAYRDSLASGPATSRLQCARMLKWNPDRDDREYLRLLLGPCQGRSGEKRWRNAARGYRGRTLSNRPRWHA